MWEYHQYQTPYVTRCYWQHFDFDLKCHPQPSLFTCWCPECGKVGVFLIHLPVPSAFSAKDNCFSFLPLKRLVPQLQTLHSKLRGAQLCTSQLGWLLYDDHMPIPFIVLSTGSSTFSSLYFSLVHVFFPLFKQQLLGGASAIAAKFFNLFPGAGCLEEISDLQKHFDNLSAVLL